MSLYVELSRPQGDISRWEKIYKRLQLLNKYYPLVVKDCNSKQKTKNNNDNDKLCNIISDILIKNDVVFFGGYSNKFYSNFIQKQHKHIFNDFTEFDVLSNHPDITSNIVLENLKEHGYNCSSIFHKSIGEIIPEHYEIKVNGETHVFIFKTIACHSYNEITIKKQKIKIATIETILSLYLAFLYTNMRYYNKNKLLCISKLLFDLYTLKDINEKGILKPFSISCYGHQDTLTDIRSKKSKTYNKFIENDVDKDSFKYNMWFLKYNPKHKHYTTCSYKKNKINKTKKNTKEMVEKNKVENNNNNENKVNLLLTKANSFLV